MAPSGNRYALKLAVPPKPVRADAQEAVSTEPEPTVDAVCPHCQQSMIAKTMRTAVWQGDQVAIVEDIPAHVCTACNEQFYDGPVSDALRRLAEDGFPAELAKSEILVPVFSLEGRVREPQLIPEDVYVD